MVEKLSIHLDRKMKLKLTTKMKRKLPFILKEKVTYKGIRSRVIANLNRNCKSGNFSGSKGL